MMPSQIHCWTLKTPKQLLKHASVFNCGRRPPAHAITYTYTLAQADKQTLVTQLHAHKSNNEYARSLLSSKTQTPTRRMMKRHSAKGTQMISERGCPRWAAHASTLQTLNADKQCSHGTDDITFGAPMPH